MENIIAHLTKTIKLNTKEKDLIISKLQIKHLAKREHVLEAGSICRFLSYIHSGCLRVYSIDGATLENNIYFGVEDWWALDLKSFIEFTPARFHIQALTDCELYQISKTDFEYLLEHIPQLEKWFRILLQNALIASENRINDKIGCSAEERYSKFKQKYPMLESRISQKHIASYLGISPEFLSKMRAQSLNRNS